MSDTEFEDLIRAFVEDALDHVGRVESILLALEQQVDGEGQTGAQALEGGLRALHTVKGNAGMLGFMACSAAVHTLEEAVKKTVKSGQVSRSNLDSLFGATTLLRGALRDIGETLEDAPAVEDSVNGLLAHYLPGTGSEAGVPEITQPGAAVPAVAEFAVPSSDFLRLRSDRVDALLVELGEVGIFLNGLSSWLQRQLPQMERGQRFEAVASFDRVRTSFARAHERAVSLRMVQLDTIFSQVPKWVRDLARALGKEVRTEIAGGDLLLDKQIVDRLQEPFIHLIRNAIDHGIEAPETRVAAGKDGRGHLYLDATAQAGVLKISLRDDGRGLNREAIIHKARQVGILGAADQPEDWRDLIFRHGFSTSQSVTEVSGRGVGMDIVRHVISELDGSIQVSSDEGRGTTFEIILPLTLAVTDILKIRSCEQLFGVAIRDVLETDAFDRARCETVGSGLIYRMPDGRRLPIVDLEQVVTAQAESPARAEQAKYCLRITRGARECMLLADALIGEEQAVLKPLRDPLFDHPMVRAGSIEGDGSVMFVLDTLALLDGQTGRA